MIITLAHLKGGTGKSSLSLVLAAYIAALGKSVLLIDADPQGSCSGWAQARPESRPLPFCLVSMPSDKLHRDVGELAARYTHTIIDTPPQILSYVRSAVVSADLVVSPVAGSNFDLWPLAQVGEMVQDAQMIKPKLKHCLIQNRVKPRTKMDRAITQALEHRNIQLLSARVCDRTIYTQISSGRTLVELDPKSPAIDEIARVATALLEFMEVKSW